MKHALTNYFSSTLFAKIITGISVVCIVVIGYGTYAYLSIKTTLENTKQELSRSNMELSSTTIALDERNKNLTQAQIVNTDLQTRLGGEVARNDFFNQQIQSISSTVGILDKLSKTDKELLQKYSNVYFLSENYVPSALAPIDPEFLLRKEKQEQIHSNIKPYLENLLRAARSDSVPFFVLSAYRSFGTQASLKASYKISYGAGTANKFSADQGYSEHQLGSTIDFTTSTIGENLTGFEKVKAYEWLTKNAYRFGFIISYPKGNKFFTFEPWHWRFVGVELATKLHTDNKYFYDWDQRVIDTYLVKIFD